MESYLYLGSSPSTSGIEASDRQQVFRTQNYQPLSSAEILYTQVPGQWIRPPDILVSFTKWSKVPAESLGTSYLSYISVIQPIDTVDHESRRCFNMQYLVCWSVGGGAGKVGMPKEQPRWFYLPKIDSLNGDYVIEQLRSHRSNPRHVFSKSVSNDETPYRNSLTRAERHSCYLHLPFASPRLFHRQVPTCLCYILLAS